MILSEEQLSQYLGKDLESRIGKFERTTREKLRELDTITKNTMHMSLLDYLTVQHQREGRSIRDLAEECDWNERTLSRVLKKYEIPIRTRTEATKLNWKDLEFRKRSAKVTRAELKKRKQEPKFRAKHAEATRAMRLDKTNEGKFYLTSFQGTRRDVGYAKSSWEANLMRIFQLLGREYTPHKKVRLTIQPEYQHLFKHDISDMEVDFVVTDPRGSLTMYEIMSHSLEKPKGVVKLEMLADQDLSVKVKPISQRFYRRLEKRFKDRINTDARFAGWEDSTSNLKNNPQKYSVEGKEQ